MKKTIFAFLFAIMFSMIIGSCGNVSSTPSNVDSVAVDTFDTTAIDTIVADTIAVDTIDVAE